jgi:hypothetical protein
MSRARQLAVQIALGAGILALAVIVWVLNQNSSSDILAVIALLGGLAIIVNVLPVANHRNGDDGKS